jgi:hypothetical protein
MYCTELTVYCNGVVSLWCITLAGFLLGLKSGTTQLILVYGSCGSYTDLCSASGFTSNMADQAYETD